MRLAFAWFVLLTTSLLSATAHAQSNCAAGRTISADTAGRCCWPGQHWARDLGRCEGPPTCPAGYAADGDNCVAQSQPASVPPASVPPATSAAPVAATTASTIYAPVAGPVYVPLGRRAYGYTEPYHGGPVPPNARVEDRRRKGAFAFGMIFASIGISAAIFQSAILASAHDYYSSCQTYDAQGYCVDYTYTQDPCAQSWWVSMLPIAGPVLSPWITHSGHDGYCNSSISQAWVVAPIAAVFELGGLLLAIYGRTTYPVLEYNHGTATRRQDRSPRFTVLPFAQGADVGITLGVTHF